MDYLLSSQEGSNQVEIARTLYEISIQQWGGQQPLLVIGRHPLLKQMLSTLVRLATADGPVLITGETGTGKELIARALFLSARSHRKTLLSVNCAQFGNENMIASELFGHRRGSFTGAVCDHRGLFEEADGGVVFLDEIGELPLNAQAMLLRTISEGEVIPVGSTRAKKVDVRVIAATNRDLPAMIAKGQFRADLYYRLRYFQLHVPSLRSRGDDWRLIADHYLNQLIQRNSQTKRLADSALDFLRAYQWPGNVRELRGCIESGFHLSEGIQITRDDVIGATEGELRHDEGDAGGAGMSDFCLQMASGEGSFWEVIYEPFMARELNRAQVRAVIAAGLAASQGSYKRLLDSFGIDPKDYLKFMDFLRHHKLKPAREVTLA